MNEYLLRMEYQQAKRKRVGGMWVFYTGKLSKLVVTNINYFHIINVLTRQNICLWGTVYWQNRKEFEEDKHEYLLLRSTNKIIQLAIKNDYLVLTYYHQLDKNEYWILTITLHY